MVRHRWVRRFALVPVAFCTMSSPAWAFDDAFGQPVPYRERVVIRRSVRPAPPSAVFSGYLPRNHAVPLYNEPPRRPSFGQGWR